MLDSTAFDPLGDPAVSSLRRTGRQYAVIIRVVTASVSMVVAVAAAATMRMRVETIAAAVVLLAWSAFYVGQILRRRARWYTILDGIVLTLLALCTPWLAAPAWLSTGKSWLVPFCTAACVAYQYYEGRLVASLVAGAVVAGLVAGTTLGRPHGSVIDGIITSYWALVVALLARIIWTLVQSSGRRADRIIANVDRARREVAVADGLRADERATSRDLHDTAASTLLMAGTGAVRDGWRLRRQAADDLAVLRSLRDNRAAAPIDLLVRLQTICDDTDVVVDRQWPDRLRVPHAVGAAVAFAVAEALSNVARHTAGATACLRVHLDERSLLVEISDNGPGFRPSAVPMTRRGVRESIEGRMASIGATTTIDSAPGRGTTIRLEVPMSDPPVPRTPESAPPSESSPGTSPPGENLLSDITAQLLRGLRWAVLAVTAVVLLVPVSFLRHYSQYRPAWPQLAAYGLLVAVALTELFLIITKYGWRAARWPVLGAALAADVLSRWFLAPGAAVTSADWIFGALGWIAVIVLLDQPLYYLGGFLLVHELITIAALARGGAATPDVVLNFIAGSLGAVGYPFGTGVAAFALRRVAVRAAAAAEETLAIRAADNLAAEMQAHRRQRFADLYDSAAPLLQGLASGALNPRDAQISHACSVEAARMRRLMAESDVVADPLLHELNAGADVAARKGVVVDMEHLGSCPKMPRSIRRALVDPMLTAIATASSKAQVRVVSGPGVLSVNVIADCAQISLPARAGEDVQVRTFSLDEHTTWVEAQWKIPSSPPSSSTTTK